MLEAKNINFSYNQKPLLNNFSISLKTGDFTMLVGENGCGKSTVLKIFAGLLKVQQGEISLYNQKLNTLNYNERARKIAVVSQGFAPTLDFTVKEMVLIGRNANLPKLAKPTVKDLEIVNEVMEELDIIKLQNTPCSNLSGGEKQRVAIAAALAQKADFLLLDEPTSALDPAHALMVMNLLVKINPKIGIIMVSHNLQLTLQFAKKVLLWNRNGEILSGNTDEILTPKNLKDAFNCEVKIISDKIDKAIYLKSFSQISHNFSKQVIF